MIPPPEPPVVALTHEAGVIKGQLVGDQSIGDVHVGRPLDDLVAQDGNKLSRLEVPAIPHGNPEGGVSLFQKQRVGIHVGIGPDRLRFDFSHNKPISDDEMININNCVNKIIEQKSDVQTRLMTPKAAVAEGALALFGEKYGEEVRVLTMGTDGNKVFSIELCGGTHVKNTKEIGKFLVVSQSAVAAGVRRVEALRDQQLVEYLKNKENEQDEFNKNKLDQVNELEIKIKGLGGNIKEVKEENILTRISILKKILEDLEVKNILLDKNKNIIKDIHHHKISIRFQKIFNYPVKRIQNLIDDQKKQLIKKIIILYSINDEKITVAVGITNDLINEYDASKIAKEIGLILGSKGGGGRKDFAQASGGSDISKIESSFEEILKKIN